MTAPLAVRHATGAKRVLFCEAVWMLATAKMESLFAAGLAREGYETHLLLPARNRAVERAFRAVCPLAAVHTIEDRLDASVREAAEADAARVLEGASLEALLGLEVDGFRAGRSALSALVRRLRIGRLDESHRDAALAALARAFAVKRVAQTLIAEVRPDLAVFVERGYTPAGEFFDASVTAGVDTVQWLSAPQSDRLLFKRYRPETRSDHPLALDDATWTAVKVAPFDAAAEAALIDTLAANYNSGAWFNRQQLQVGKRAAGRDEARAALGVVPGRKAAGIFCHILYDATFFYGESLYPDYETWLIETVRHAIANPNLDWLIKVHPVNVWRSKMDGKAMEQLEAAALRRAFGELPAHVRLVPADTALNTWAFFGAIDYGLTVRGTVGMEMPCLGIPTVTAGTGRYSGRGFTIDPATRAEYATVLSTLHEVPPLDAATMSLARRYAHATFELRPVKFAGFKIDYSPRTFGVHERSVDVKVSAAQAEGFHTQADFVRLIRWLTGSRAGDLLMYDIE
ncbi:MAG: hypothetical protein O9277_00505 [Magnetospirillum sp.]|nr:hypothetical protein [Magnetospirillum sp.]